MAQENGAGPGRGDGPSAGKMKKVIIKLLENNDYNPGITLGQIRNKLQKKFVDKYPAFDFSSVAFKVHSRALIEEVIHAYEEVTRAGTAGDTSGNGAAKATVGKDNKEKEKEKKRTHSDHNDTSRAAEATKKVKVEGHAEGGGKSAEQPPDPRLVRLKKLATAMGLVPGIYKDFGVMDVEEKVKALRQRLHAKGAVFDILPSLDQIKAAEEAYKLRKDLEGIDAGNIVMGKRGTVGPSASGSASISSLPTSSALSLAIKVSPLSALEKEKKGNKENKSSGAGTEGSSSEQEMDL